MVNRDKVIVVAAGNAWPFYDLTSAYVCPDGRQFGDAGRMAFYSGKTIHGVAARIEKVISPVVLSQAAAARGALSLDPREQRVGNVIAAALAGAWKEGEATMVILLSAKDDPDTTTFDPVIHHGRVAWAMSRRYVRLEQLVVARTTADLETAPKLGFTHD